MRPVGRWLAAARVGTAVMLLTGPAVASAHPIHTTLTELRYDPANRTVQLTIRMFAEDVLTAMDRSGNGARAPLEIAVPSYALSLVTLRARDQAIPLQSCGVRTTGDLLWLCLQAHAPQGLKGLSVMSRLLFDLFDDQINIVQASYDGRRQSLLFTKGDAAKPLP